MTDKSSKWRRLQSGQALMEYWPTIPVAIAIMVSAGILVGFLNVAFLRTVNGLDGYCKAGTPAETVAEMHNHRIEASAAVYDPVTNRTTIAYTVTSGSSPSISHWVLGIPRSVADRIIQISEPAAWTDGDPTTGAVGLKFDIGYEADGGGGGGGKGGGKKASVGGLMLASYTAPRETTLQSSTAVRVISITLDGNYQFGSVTVTTKAGADQIGTGTVSGPIGPVVEDSNNGRVDRSKGC